MPRRNPQKLAARERFPQKFPLRTRNTVARRQDHVETAALGCPPSEARRPIREAGKQQRRRRAAKPVTKLFWRKRVGVEPTGNRKTCCPPVLKTGTITGPHALPQPLTAIPRGFCKNQNAPTPRNKSVSIRANPWLTSAAARSSDTASATSTLPDISVALPRSTPRVG
jgi:hypothetical protein